MTDELREALDSIANAKPFFAYVIAGPGGVDFDKPGSPYDRGKQEAYAHIQAFARATLQGEAP